jgi:hypothetical protein
MAALAVFAGSAAALGALVYVKDNTVYQQDLPTEFEQNNTLYVPGGAAGLMPAHKPMKNDDRLKIRSFDTWFKTINEFNAGQQSRTSRFLADYEGDNGQYVRPPLTPPIFMQLPNMPATKAPNMYICTPQTSYAAYPKRDNRGRGYHSDTMEYPWVDNRFQRDGFTQRTGSGKIPVGMVRVGRDVRIGS